MIMRKALPRRTFLRGMGTAVALPFMDAMVPAFASAAAQKPPVRMAFVYVPNGIDMRNWNPDYEGKLAAVAAHPEAAGALQGRHPAARQPDPQHRARAARWRRRSRPLLRIVPDRHPGQEEHHRYQGRRLDATRSWPARSAARRASRRSSWAWKTRANRAIAIRATPAPTPTTWRGGARRSRCRRFSIRARCSSACSATAWC